MNMTIRGEYAGEREKKRRHFCFVSPLPLGI